MLRSKRAAPLILVVICREDKMNCIEKKLPSFISRFNIAIICIYSVLFSPNAKANEQKCFIHPNTQHIINKIYGETEVKETDKIKFLKKSDLLSGHPFIERVTLDFDPLVIHSPISVIVQKHYRYSRGYIGSQLIAKYSIDDNISSISMNANIMYPKTYNHSADVNIFALAKTNSSIVYNCRQIYYSWGDEGCC